MNPPEHISYSQLSFYEHCPRCYFLRYHVGVKTIAGQQLVFGSAVHNAIELYHKFGKVPDNLDRKVKAAFEVYAARYPANYLSYVEFGKDTPILFTHPDTGEPLRKPFKLAIDGAHTRGLAHIAEHKTSAQAWTQDRVDGEHQATLYSFTFRQLFGMEEDGIVYNVIVKPKFGSKYYLQTFRTRRDRSDYARFYYWADGILEKMERGEFNPSNYVTWKCDLCKICASA